LSFSFKFVLGIVFSVLYFNFITVVYCCGIWRIQ